MKRGGNLKRTPLKRSKPLARSEFKRPTASLSRSAGLKPPSPGPRSNRQTKAAARLRERLAAKRREPGYAAWHAPIEGPCDVCGNVGKLTRHHIVKEVEVRQVDGAPWDLRNSLKLGHHLFGGKCRCHRRHHDRFALIPMSAIPDEAIVFAVETLGVTGARLAFERAYAGAAEDPRLLAYGP